VILSLQLPFAVVPLIVFTSDRNKMGAFANRLSIKIVAWSVAVLIITLNLAMLLTLVERP
jgi:manganese transport protein